eukprot:3427944-Amphidinium_carterae.1
MVGRVYLAPQVTYSRFLVDTLSRWTAQGAVATSSQQKARIRDLIVEVDPTPKPNQNAFALFFSRNQTFYGPLPTVVA